jgi:glutathione S-transferase
MLLAPEHPRPHHADSVRLPASQNGYKVRLLLHHLRIPYRTEIVEIFQGAVRILVPRHRPTGAVPARLEDGGVLAESNAILGYLAKGTPYLPDDRFGVRRSIVDEFRADYVQTTIGSLRY